MTTKPRRMCLGFVVFGKSNNFRKKIVIFVSDYKI